MATLALKGLVAAKKDLATGGLALPTLGYDQAKDLIRLLREVTGRPVVLVLDGLETIQHSADLLSSQRTFLNAFLKHPSDWPGVHIFLGVRVESLQQEIGAFLSSLEPASSVQLRELPLMELGEPAERARLLDYIRAHVPATAQVPDDSLLDMVGGYPGVLFQWLKAVPDTPGELARLAEDARNYRYRELVELAKKTINESDDLAAALAQLILLPEFKTYQDWQPYERAILGDKSDQIVFDLKKEGILNPKAPFPSFGHSTCYEALKDWLLKSDLGIALSQRSAKTLIDRLVENIRDAEPGAYPFAVALALLSATAARLDLPERFQLFARATHSVLDSLRSQALCIELADKGGHLVLAAREYPPGAPLVAIALANILFSVGSAKERGREGRALEDLNALASAFPDMPAVQKLYVAGFVIRGRLRDDEGDIKSALADFDFALQLAPNDIYALYCRALHHWRKPDPAAAFTDVTRAAGVDPKNENIWWLRAYLLYDLRKWLEALGAFRELCKRATSQQEWLPLRVWAIRARIGEGAQASEELRAVLAQAPNQGEPMAAQIGRFLIGDLTAEALLCAARAPGKRDTQLNLCDSYFYVGIERLIAKDLAGARGYLQKCRDTNCATLFDWGSAGVELQNLNEGPT